MTNLLSGIEKNQLEYQVFLDGVPAQTKKIISSVYHSSQIQELARHEENNPWHDHENVLNHVEKVFANLQKLLYFDFVKDQTLHKKYLDYSEQKAIKEGDLSRKETLLLACSLHDVSKGQSRPEGDEVAPGETYLYVKEDGLTSGLGHEHASALLVPQILGNSGLPTDDLDHIQYLVEKHDQFNLDYCRLKLTGYKDGNIQNDVVQMKKDQPDYAIELTLHIIADEWGAAISKWKTEYLLNGIVAGGYLL